MTKDDCTGGFFCSPSSPNCPACRERARYLETPVGKAELQINRERIGRALGAMAPAFGLDSNPKEES